MYKVVVVEDDCYLREEIANTFIKEGYSVLSISSFDTPDEEIMNAAPDLIVLDLNLPGKSGFELCKILKAKTTVPILILTACDTLTDKLKAIGLGADTFLTKPCHPKRLAAHAFRLIETYKRMRNTIQAGSLSLDIDTYKVSFSGTEMVLPETEGKILQILMEYHPDLVEREALFRLLWGGKEYVDENILQVNMTRLRKKLSSIGIGNVICTSRGKGYYLETGE